jgi:23S rRNA (guanosine2251-2'-O)-methyltransferase
MIIYGKQVCLHVLEHHSRSVKTVYIAKKGILPSGLYNAYKDKIKFLENKWAQSMSKGGNHQGLLVDVEDFRQSDIDSIKKGSFLVVLDGLTDVGNIGAIVRSSYALGADGIIAIGVNQLSFSGIARTSAGALFDMPFAIIPNGLDVLNKLKQSGFKLYGAAMEGEPIDKAEFASKKVLVVGSEGEGLSKRVLPKMDTLVSIPMKHDFDSLNVSVATAILLYRMSYEN